VSKEGKILRETAETHPYTLHRSDVTTDGKFRRQNFQINFSEYLKTLECSTAGHYAPAGTEWSLPTTVQQTC